MFHFILFLWQIREADPDVVVFQEVRSDADNHDRNQIAELQSILGQYQHKLYAVAEDVIPPDKLYKIGWEAEGMKTKLHSADTSLLTLVQAWCYLST